MTGDVRGLIATWIACACALACDREPEPPPVEDPPAAREEISTETRETVEEFVRERTDEEVEAADDELAAASPSLITFSVEDGSLADVIRILARITREHVAVASVLDGSLDCVRIAIITRQEITTGHAIELTRFALAETGIELRHTPYGFVVRPMDGRTVACGATGRASAESVPAPAAPYVERPFVEPGPNDLVFALDRASLDDIVQAFSLFDQTFEVDPNLESSVECVRVSIVGEQFASRDHAAELVRLAVADANIELDRRNVFRAIASREIRCTATPE